jgi:hypothetical protein
MSLFKIADGQLYELSRTTFAIEELLERRDIQTALKKSISAIAPDCLVISEEFSYWQDSNRRIDLLAIDRSGSLVVIELKRDEKGAHMDLQALRYASMVSTMTFEKACQHYQDYLDKEVQGQDAKSIIIDFIELSEADIDDFGNDVKIILASADFSKELTTSVLWLRDKGIDIKCVRLTPYKHGEEVLINAEQIIPIPEAEEYLVRFREKSNEQRAVSTNGRDYSTYQYKDQIYNKRNLALAVLTDWVEMNEPASLAKLIESFPDLINRKIVMDFETIPTGGLKRWHSNEDELLTLVSGETIAISNQWGLKSITLLIDKLSSEGFEIEKIEK